MPSVYEKIAEQPLASANNMFASRAAATYRNEQLMNLSPVEVVAKLYDVAILGCKKQNLSLAQRALTELIGALNFELEGELSLQLFQLYDYCKKCIRKGNKEEAISLLEELRSAWSEAFNLRPIRNG